MAPPNARKLTVQATRPLHLPNQRMLRTVACNARARPGPRRLRAGVRRMQTMRRGVQPGASIFLFVMVVSPLAAQAPAEKSTSEPTVAEAVHKFHEQHPDASPIGEHVTPPKLLKSVPLTFPDGAEGEI